MRFVALALLPLALTVGACSVESVSAESQGTAIPAGAADVAARLQNSPRHAEWAMIPAAPGSRDSIAAWVVYPERRDNAPVVVVIHEIFGLSSWVRGVADQLAADGFIAIAPDLLSIERGGATTDSMAAADARAMIQRVTPDKMNAMVAAVGQYGMNLPAAKKVYGVVGYCWGGSASFNHAVFNAPGLKAAVVYYGSSPSAEDIAKVRIPVLGLYGEDDQRVNATIGRADSTIKAIGGTFEQHIYAGAGHGFLRAQDQRPANLEAARRAWPETLRWFRRHLN
ncbi:dienelactone hydrolase family protein [Pseudogemmatithrix spongiicola]|uniref:Dienelactone hydrolase family protein n=1 Tax=Pseudogemmatithrix spongiicola TaxID=3062599 RepID=A0AA49JX64_9BACT|nr:dienelactone hydrolase family protein [Gemmatimonadaceae bacterium 'strain 138']WKW13704.1 dienelactone hydrolase family protein [Gemmatimonadaceae bacterium 'strain 318']